MRNLTKDEIQMVAGAGDECSSDGGNTYMGVSNLQKFGDDIISAYEGLVAATSYIIERVAKTF
jgi:hypothetical protein